MSGGVISRAKPQFELKRTELFSPSAEQGDPDALTRSGGSRGRRLLCRLCDTPITSDADRCEVDGAHVHERINPHGDRCVFGCFGQAAGARAVGQPTAEHSWFAGHAWSLSLCGGCGSHLGWLFQGPAGAVFHGLVLDRLSREESNDVS